MSSLIRPLAAFAVLAAVAAIACWQLPARADNSPDGKALFKANCAACHGETARGDRKASDLGFPIKMPDFGDCGFATREADTDWLSSIHRGGRARAFPRLMPAFDQALSEDEINAVVAYLRSLCTKSGYPRGEFNLPLAMFTEKAFPEDEVLNQTAFNTRGPTGITSTTIFEKRFGKRGQLEVNLPVQWQRSAPGAPLLAGIGDMGVAWKQNVLADVDKGRILSLLGEAVLPTGDAKRGFGNGYASFETHALFAQMLPKDFFLQGDVFGVFPTGKNQPDELHGNFGLGRTFAEDDGWGRSWTPQVELLATKPFQRGAGVDLDLVPQLQVSLSRRQHILFSAGERIPLNHNGPDRRPQFIFYLIWDWYDAGLLRGW